MAEIKITAPRVRLRLIDLSDLDSIHELHSLPETDQYNALGIPRDKEHTKSTIQPWIEDNQLDEIKKYTFAIDQRSNGEFIGLFGLKLGTAKYNRAEVWFKIHSNFWNKGYATESLRAVIDYGFETLKLHRIEAGCAVDNIGSYTVLEKSGMTREGCLREVLPLKSGWSDNYQYAILQSDIRIP